MKALEFDVRGRGTVRFSWTRKDALWSDLSDAVHKGRMDPWNANRYGGSKAAWKKAVREAAQEVRCWRGKEFRLACFLHAIRDDGWRRFRKRSEVEMVGSCAPTYYARDPDDLLYPADQYDELAP